MAKREIKRDIPSEVSNTPKGDETMLAEVDEVKTPPADTPGDQPKETDAPKAETPKKTVPLNETVSVAKVPTVIVIRVLNKLIMFNDGRKMRRAEIVPGKPVTITITQ